MNVDTSAPIKTHEKFNAGDADLRIQSSDGVLFRIHSKNLETHTTAFPGAEFSTQDEVVYLSEPANVLEILFQFVYPSEYPTLQENDFETVLAVAEAVEKYEVFSAKMPCDVRLGQFVPKHASEVLQHGAKHDKHFLMDAAATYFMSHAASLKLWNELPSHLRTPWTLYRNAWQTILNEVYDYIQSNAYYQTGCEEEWVSQYDTVVRFCERCRSNVTTWVADIERAFDNLSNIKAHVARTSREPFEADPEEVLLPLCGHCTESFCKGLPQVARVFERRLEQMKPFSHFLPSGNSRAH